LLRLSHNSSRISKPFGSINGHIDCTAVRKLRFFWFLYG
jgi:hypothetical protein